jgi:lambda family phage portal protein
MQRTALDRLIGYVSPETGHRRMLARARSQALQQASAAMTALQGSSTGAYLGGGGGYNTSNGRDRFFSQWGAIARSADADMLPDLVDQRAQSRDLVRNNAIAAAAVNINVVRAVGTGLAFVATPHLPTLGWTVEQGAAWREEVQAEFSLWADSPDCDWSGQQNFFELQDTVLRGMLESGDLFTVLPDAPAATATQPYRLRVQLLEADRVGNPLGQADTPTVAGGIRRDGQGGVVTGVHVYRQHPGAHVLRASLLQGDWYEPIGPNGRRRILHHLKRLRPEQARGVPYLAPVMALFRLLGQYTDAELKAAVTTAFLAIVVETEGGMHTAAPFGLAPQPAADLGSGAVPGEQHITAGAGQASAQPQEIMVGTASVVGLAPGEKATVVNPTRPNPAFAQFVDSVLHQLGAGTHLGSEMLLHRYTTSYTAARAAWLDAWRHLLDMRTLVARSFCQPVFETWLAEAVAIGRVRAPGFFADARLRWAYTRAAWHGDSQGSLNPKDEVAAFAQALDMRLVTRERAEWELYGSDWSATYPTKLAEHQRMQRDGMVPVPRAGAPAPAPAPAPAALDSQLSTE